MNTFYLVCFSLGLVFSVLAVFGGLGRLHAGHFHLGHFGHLHGGSSAAAQSASAAGAAIHRAGAANHPTATGSAFNGFTVAAFLCWFGGVGYLLHNFTGLIVPLVLLLAVISGTIAAGLMYGLLFKLLLPRERVLTAEDTRMEGVVAQVSDAIRAGGGTGEILFLQEGTRRSAAARNDGEGLIDRGMEVVVLRYERGIAWVSPLPELSELSLEGGASRNERSEPLSR